MEIKDLKFTGSWRSYQKRVLDHEEQYLADGKIHIVAAPGSGKTTLGIELMIRLGKPALILAPSITIREQWKERILEAFVPENEKKNAEKIISQNLKEPALITIATYQALHSAMTRYREEMSEASEDKEIDSEPVSTSSEQVDFSGYNLVENLKKTGVSVLCLDECHHLRSEWWKALEDFKTQMECLKVVALTATPPYDSTPAEWKRYEDMCGVIDEEITIPELVKEGSLCPHQDYVYFNYPTKEEMKIVSDFKTKSSKMLDSLMEDKVLNEAIRNHKVFTGEKSGEEMLEEPAYLSALLIYSESKNIPISSKYQRLLGVEKLPVMSVKWMEILLQKLLYDAKDDFFCEESYRETLTNELKRQGLIEKRKVILTTSTAIEKMLISSEGKIDSIISIAEHEYQSMKQDLRMLILTDYIRKESEKNLGDVTEIAHKMGVLPFFEMIRRHFNKNLKERSKDYVCPRLGVLCGSIVIIPATSKEMLIRIAEEDRSGCAERMQFAKVGQLSETDYLKVVATGNEHFLTRIVTELFAQGQIQIIIGTKSLLGEGWDSPCINSLILASFVGSYMLSNQMRGRAIRVMKTNPNKTSNIWHLVCIKPPKLMKQEQKEGNYYVSDSEDMELLNRRMEHFMGLHYDEDTVVNGISRFTSIHTPFTESNVKKTNEEMLMRSDQREELIARWERALAVSEHIEVTEETEVPDRLVTMAVFYDAIRDIVISAVLGCLAYSSNISSFFILIALLFAVSRFPKLIILGSPMKRLNAIGKGIVKAMQSEGYLKENAYHIDVDHTNGIFHCIYMRGGTGWEKSQFTTNICEFFGSVDNQRYLLVKKGRHRGKYGFYCVPEAFANNKEKAENFAACMKPYIGGGYDLVYTRSENGRRLLLEGRAHAYANKQERCITKKKVKSALE